MASGAPSGGGGGYTIPISLSAADSFSVPQNLQSPSNVIFGPYKSSGGSAGDIDGGKYTAEQSPYNPVTATSSTALGGDSQASSNLGGSPSNGNNTTIIVVAIAISAAAIVAAMYFKR